MECGEPARWHRRCSPGRRFNGAALVGVRRVQLDVPVPTLVTWLQRSRTRWSAESTVRPDPRRASKQASTEPHSLECGELKARGNLAARLPMLQRSRTRWSAESRRGCRSETGRDCFNGAALVGVRRAAHGAAFGRAVVELQRSRTRWSAERRQSAPTPPHARPGFNGAALVGVRRAAPSAASLSATSWLQRSRTRWSAERAHCRRWWRCCKELQRSRTRWSAESGHGCGAWLCRRRASTEPHSLECGERSWAVIMRKSDGLQRSRTRWSAERC